MPGPRIWSKLVEKIHLFGKNNSSKTEDDSERLRQIQNQRESLESELSSKNFYNTQDVAEVKYKLGLTYLELAHKEQNEVYFAKALECFQFAWDIGYRNVDFCQYVLKQLISECNGGKSKDLAVMSVTENPAHNVIGVHRNILFRTCQGTFGFNEILD